MSEHKPNDQWVQDGRMYKAVKGRCLCFGCSFDDGSAGCSHLSECSEGENYIFKDLGPVDDNGCLAEERTGSFPTVKQDGCVWYVELQTVSTVVLCIGYSRQETIDKWNHRETPSV